MKKLITLTLVCLVLIATLSILAVAASAKVDMAQVIVGFKEADENLIKTHGGSVQARFSRINAVAVSLPASEVENLKKNPKVAYVENDSEVYALAQSVPWGVTKIEAPTVWAGDNKGTGVKVAVLDTGIDTSHPDLRVMGGATFISGTTTFNDDNGHGTHCAGIIAALDNSIGVVGVAPEASLYAVKVLSRTGSGSISNLINGIEWSITNGMQVISMSIGSTSDSPSFHAEVDRAVNAGIVVVAAAGNDGPASNTVNFPARYTSVIAVGATSSNDVIASFSSRGPEVDVSAPGVSIYSTYRGGSYSTMSGTSMAAPHVAGTVALILNNGAHSTSEVKTILQNTAVDLGSPSFDTSYGYGRINASKAMGNIATPPPPPPPATPDFTIAASTSSFNTQPAGVSSYTLTLTSANGFAGTVNLATSAPSGWTASVNPIVVALTAGGSASSTVTVTASGTATQGTYSITATGKSGLLTHSVSTTANVRTVPSAPQNLAATAGNNQITLNWAAPASNGGASVTNYNVYKGTVAGAETLLATLGNVLSYTDNAVTNGQTYYYRVSAVNTVGESAKSNTIPATPAVPTAKTMTVAVTTNSPKYSWGSLGLLTVTVKDASSGAALAGASVAIKFSYPNGATAYTFTRTTDTTGTARAIFIVFYLVPVGTYSVTSTTSLSGYQTKTGQTTFNVVK